MALTEIEKLAGKRVLGLNISPHRLKRTKNKAPEISTLAVQASRPKALEAFNEKQRLSGNYHPLFPDVAL